jgi:hypothetical protein
MVTANYQENIDINEGISSSFLQCFYLKMICCQVEKSLEND